jgi:hypothetical protein
MKTRISNKALQRSGGSAAYALAYLGSSIMPFQITALINSYHLSATDAGTFGFFDIFSFATSMFMMPKLLQGFGIRRTALAGCVGCFLGNAILWRFRLDQYALYACSMLIGVSQALLARSTICTASREERPDIPYLIISAASTSVIVVIVLFIPLFNSYFGNRGVFLLYCSATVALLPLLFLLPAEHAGMPARATGSSHVNSAALGIMAIAFSASLAVSMAWSFATYVAHDLNISDQSSARIADAGIALGVVSLLLISRIKSSGNIFTFLSVAVVGTAIASTFICIPSGVSTYTAAVIAHWVFSSAMYAYLPATSAVLDNTGGIGTLSTGSERIGYAFGAPIAGYIIDHASLDILGILVFFCCVGALPLAAPAILRGIKMHRAQMAPS